MIIKKTQKIHPVLKKKNLFVNWDDHFIHGNDARTWQENLAVNCKCFSIFFRYSLLYSFFFKECLICPPLTFNLEILQSQFLFQSRSLHVYNSETEEMNYIELAFMPTP